jgi:magnesium chelatase family protein
VVPGGVSRTAGNNGVLFLDELPEFSRAACEALRQPLEEGEITVSRAMTSVRFPASFALIAAANPCPCGHLGDSRFACRCSLYDLHRYASRLSGPLLDRIDLYVQAERLTAEELTGAADAEPTAPVRARVLAARTLQRSRQGAENGRLASAEVAAGCQVRPAARRTLMTAVDRLGLSARGFHRALRVARTIADLAGSDRVEDEHVREALSLRHLPIIGDPAAQLI